MANAMQIVSAISVFCFSIENSDFDAVLMRFPRLLSSPFLGGLTFSMNCILSGVQYYADQSTGFGVRPGF